ncbi:MULTISPECIES: hypothetical protein [Paenibacillus]|uniref:Lipoprotein n=1 Tax=Paenibacillus odorifer TaxID=189426 RepID=A0A1R0XL85_9BACL|nr:MULTISPECIES: hypothetical protein [Paenibacillus]AIQ33206.1 hypothetical protein R50345_00120 [Paenibacillus sp. FSL R5-0345]OMD35873.1 hypothetical protein BSK52_26240 [Paenibacillus odorifer]
MKQFKIFSLIMISCILTLILASCGTKEPTWDTFEGALNEKSFPVPHEANSPDQTTTNVAMDYVRYSLPGLKEKNGIPDPYMEAIKAWGWTEEEDDDSDSSGVFLKDGLTVHLTVHDDYFVVMIPKEKKTSIKGLKTK